jgi:hypothetical protein
MHTCAVDYIYFASTCPAEATPPSAEALERRRAKSRGGSEEVPSREKKIGDMWRRAELKWGGRLLRNGARREYAIIFGRHGAGVGYVYARVDVSFGRLGEALGAG